MNLFAEALAWVVDVDHWMGESGITKRVLEHLGITAVAVMAAALIGLPVGVVVGHARKGTGLVGAIAGAARAIPTLGLLTLFGLAFGIGLVAPLLALIVLALPSVLVGAYSGIQAVDPGIVDAARAQGMRPAQVIGLVELPLAAPVLIGGLRAAVRQVVATATLAAYIADFGLGRYLFTGLKSRDYAQMLAGAMLVTVLALSLEFALAGVQRIAVKRLRVGEPVQ